MKNCVVYTLTALLVISCKSEHKRDKEENSIMHKEKSIDHKIQNQNEEVVVEEENKDSTGLTYRKINELKGFENYSGRSGAMIGNSHIVGLLHNAVIPEQRLIAFSELHYDPERKVVYKLIDTLIISKLDSNHYIAFGSCLKSEKFDDQIVALYEYVGDYKYYTKIKKAWRFNTQQLNIESIAVDSIKCINEGYGI